MPKIKPLMVSLLILSLFSPCLFSQQKRTGGIFGTVEIDPALKAEHFSLSIRGKDEEFTSKFKSYLFMADFEWKVLEGLSAHLLLGYSLSDFDGQVFRGLPFSVQLDVGYLGGLVSGLEIEKSLIRFPDYELIFNAQMLASFRFWRNSWEISNLNVGGSVTGSPAWLRAQIGPVIRYLGFDYISPYISIQYNKLWGRFRMEEDIQDLSGLEKKKIRSSNNFILKIGTDYEVTDSTVLTGEVTVFPYSDGVDIGAMVCFRFRI